MNFISERGSVTVLLERADLFGKQVFYCTNNCTISLYSLFVLLFGRYSVQLDNKYVLFAGWEDRMVKNCDRGLKNTARDRRPRAAFSSPRSQFFIIRIDPKPANDMFIFFFLR